MGLNGIMSSALTTLHTNSAALRVVSGNIANVNTTDYARRSVNFQTLSTNGELSGVDIATIQRVVDQFLTQEAVSANSASAQYSVESSVFDQINALLGSPGDGTALTSKLSDIFAALGQAALSPTTSSSQNSIVNAMQDLASSISSISNSLSQLAVQTDNQISTSVSSANSLINQIYTLNEQIKLAYSAGAHDTAFLDQRDGAVNKLAELIDIRTVHNSDGTLMISTLDGVNLVGDTYAHLTYSSSTDGSFQPITVQDINPQTGQLSGTAQNFDSHLTGGKMKGLIEMRDTTIADLRNELGAFAQGVANSFNAVHNANSAYPPPDILTGRNTGLIAGDSLNFTGKTTIATTDASGVLSHRVDVDFDAGTISVDGGPTTSFTNTVGDFVTTLNTALGTVGASATFAGGQLTLNAPANEGVVVSDTDSAALSSRAGTGFSQFFGLNDLFRTSITPLFNTGVSGGDDCGIGSNGVISLSLKGPNGEVVGSANVNITTGMTFNQAIAAVNTALNGYASLTLNSDGSVTTTISPSYSGYELQVSGDTTTRGSTGVSLTDLLGIGANKMASLASGFSLNSTIAGDSSLIALAKPDFSATQILGAGDSSGLLALQGLATSSQAFLKAGNLNAQTTSLESYAAAFYQDIGMRSEDAATNKQIQDDRLVEAQTRLSNLSGVSLDEELSNMMIYQQAYSAGARVLTMVGQLYDTLLQII